MRALVALLAAGLLSSCLVAREDAIRKEAARLVPDCHLDDTAKIRWTELEPWLYRADACDTTLWCREKQTVKCQTTRILTATETGLQLASELLKCAPTALSSERIEFGPNDPAPTSLVVGS
jgi:hypothetical protein